MVKHIPVFIEHAPKSVFYDDEGVDLYKLIISLLVRILIINASMNWLYCVSMTLFIQ